MKFIKPTRLRKGDVIGLVAPSSPEKTTGRVEKGVRYLEKCGYRVIVGAHIEDRNGYLAGSDADRAADLNAMFANKNIKAVMCTRGGYGAARILPLLDWAMIKRNPKIFVGFSDGTALNLALLAKANLVSFTGALPGVDLWKEKINAFTEEHFWRAITSPKPLPSFVVRKNTHHSPLITHHSRSVLLGGNLALVTSLIGTKYFPKINNAAWFLEDVTEEPYRIDRMLNQLLLAGVFKNASGVVFGKFRHCESSDRKSQTIDDVIADFAERVKCPVFSGIDYGHVEKKLTLPIGISVQIDRRKIRLLESATV